MQEKYPLFQSVLDEMDRDDVDFEAHEVTSEDGWILTVFHVFFTEDADTVGHKEDKYPLLF